VAIGLVQLLIKKNNNNKIFKALTRMLYIDKKLEIRSTRCANDYLKKMFSSEIAKTLPGCWLSGSEDIRKIAYFAQSVDPQMLKVIFVLRARKST